MIGMGRRSRRRRRGGIELSFRPKHISFNRRKLLTGILNWFVLILIAAITGYAFVTFCYQTVTVTGPSMSDTLNDGQVVVVNKLVYNFHAVERYDIIAFSQVDSGDYYEIKRVIGLPEETVKISDGYVYIDGTRLDKLPFDEAVLTSGAASTEIVLGENEYFVLGDNVNNSEDSRYTNVGNISSNEILGKVVYIFSPKEDRGKVR